MTDMENTKHILIAAGGTGGHIFPAEALAEILKSRGHKVYLATDVRGMRFVDNFPADNVRVIAGATVFSKSPHLLFKAMYQILKGVLQSISYIRSNKIDIVVGFGGYPSFAPLLAGKILLKPSILHEQNAVLGRANRLLAKFSKQVALSFPRTKFTDAIKQKSTFIGNPLRGIVRGLKTTDYISYNGKSKFNLVVFGGSQGAKIFTDIVPAALKLLPKVVRNKIKLTQQVPQTELSQMGDLYKKLDMNVTISPFFNDMPSLIANSHIVIGRAGATTVAELCYIGRPSLLVPLPGALDADQANNAKNIEDAGGGYLCVQNDFTAQYLAERLKQWMKQPNMLNEAAKNAKKLGQPNAADNLADLVEHYSQ